MSAAIQTDLTPAIRKLENATPLTDDERRAIGSLPASVRMLEPHQDIVRERDRPSQCCVILSGWAYRYKLLEEGKRQIVSLHVAGDLPDLHSVHLGAMDHALATLTACRVAFIPHDSIRGLMRDNPSLAARLWRETLVDGSIYREWITCIGRRSAYCRIAHLFCEMYLKLSAVGLADDFRYDFAATQSDLGDALGLSNVHVNRVLQELRGQNLISLQGRKLVIRDWPELTKVAQFNPDYLYLQERAAA